MFERYLCQQKYLFIENLLHAGNLIELPHHFFSAAQMELYYLP